MAIVLRIFLLLNSFLLVYCGHQCYSCTTYCKTLPNGKLDPETCDCEGLNLCEAEQCFTKVEIFSDELTAIIQVICIFYCFPF